MVNYQWGVFWVDLNPVKGSEPSGRPVLVVSAEEMNVALPIVTVVALTSAKPGRHIYPVEVLLPAGQSGLPKDCIAMAHQIRAIGKERLGDKCGRLESEELREQMRRAIKMNLDMLM